MHYVSVRANCICQLHGALRYPDIILSVYRKVVMDEMSIQISKLSNQWALADRNGFLGTLCKVHPTLPVPNMTLAFSTLIDNPALAGKTHYLI